MLTSIKWKSGSQEFSLVHVWTQRWESGNQWTTPTFTYLDLNVEAINGKLEKRERDVK